jgi:hypothetical protein
MTAADVILPIGNYFEVKKAKQSDRELAEEKMLRIMVRNNLSFLWFDD